MGMPQVGNLSPILSNIMLNELDKELEARGLNFVRYADDCVIAVGSSAAANRVMQTVTKWIEGKLGLKMNMTKTRVTKPSKLKYLGFGFVKMGDEWKTSQKRYWELRKMGAPEWMAKQSAGFADHYQAVAKTTGLRKISKEILAKRGLISCVEYYLN